MESTIAPPFTTYSKITTYFLPQKNMKILVPRSPANNKQNLLHQGCWKVPQIMKEISAKVAEKSPK
jgi:hypothetical protein